MHRHLILLRALALLAVCAVVALPAHGTSTERGSSRACASAKANSASTSSTSAASASSQHDRTAGNRPATRNMSSSVTAGPDGLSGTTTMPDGSTVTVKPGRGPAAAAEAECVENEGSAKAGKNNQSGKQPKPHKENR